jgi:hypothetical protein
LSGRLQFYGTTAAANGTPEATETTGKAHSCRATPIKSTGIETREYRKGFLDPDLNTVSWRVAEKPLVATKSFAQGLTPDSFYRLYRHD